MWKCSVFVHEMVIHVHPQERTQGRSRESELVLERHSHCLPQQGHMEGESKETGATRQVERRQKHTRQGKCLSWEWGGVQRQRSGGFLMHLNVTRPQSGEGERRTLWQGQLYYTSAHGSLLSQMSGSAPLPLYPDHSFLSCLSSSLAQFGFPPVLAPVLQGSPGWSVFQVHRGWTAAAPSHLTAGSLHSSHIGGHGRVSRCFGASGDWPAGYSGPLSSAASFGLNPHRGWHC